MRKSVKRAAAMGVMAAVWAGIGLVGLGCEAEVRQVDREVQAQLEQSRLLREGGQSDLAQARQHLQEAAAITEASPGVRAHSAALFGQAEKEAANIILRQIDRAEMDAMRLIWEIDQLTGQIRTSATLIEGYRGHEPSAALQAVQRQIAEARGGPGRAAWIEHEQSQLPTLSAVRQEISRLQGEIATSEENVQTLRQQREQAVDQAEELFQQAEAADGQQALEVYSRAAEHRRESDDLLSRIEVAEVGLSRLHRDLEVAEAQQGVLTAVVQELEQLARQIETGWTEIRQQIEVQTDLTRQILEGNGEMVTISQKANELSELLEKIEADQQLVERNLTSAIQNIQRAASDAETLGREIAERQRDPARRDLPETRAWEDLGRVYHPAVFRIQEAAARHALATFYHRLATGTGMRLQAAQRLEQALEPVNLQAPQVLRVGGLAQQRQQQVAQAQEAYQQADELLQNVAEAPGAPRDRQEAAQVARIFTLYGWSQLARAMGEQRQAENMLREARLVREQALERGAMLPAMPPGLVPTGGGEAQPRGGRGT